MCEHTIEQALDKAATLLSLADEVEVDCEDYGCLALAGVIRDCGRQIRRTAQELTKERERAKAWFQLPC